MKRRELEVNTNAITHFALFKRPDQGSAADDPDSVSTGDAGVPARDVGAECGNVHVQQPAAGAELLFRDHMPTARDEAAHALPAGAKNAPVPLSVEEGARILETAPGPGLRYRAAFSVANGSGLSASEVTHLKVGDVDSDRMLIRVEQGKQGPSTKIQDRLN